MKIFKNINDAWIQGYIDGCVHINGTYTGVPPIPALQVPTTEDPIAFYYQDGLREGELFSLKIRAGL